MSTILLMLQVGQHLLCMSFVCSAAFTSLVLELFAAQLGERIIDFGCRSGEVTLEIKKTSRTRPWRRCWRWLQREHGMLYVGKCKIGTQPSAADRASYGQWPGTCIQLYLTYRLH